MERKNKKPDRSGEKICKAQADQSSMSGFFTGIDLCVTIVFPETLSVWESDYSRSGVLGIFLDVQIPKQK